MESTMNRSHAAPSAGPPLRRRSGAGSPNPRWSGLASGDVQGPDHAVPGDDEIAVAFALLQLEVESTSEQRLARAEQHRRYLDQHPVEHTGIVERRRESTASHHPHIASVCKGLDRAAMIGWCAGDERDVLVRRFQVAVTEDDGGDLR